MLDLNNKGFSIEVPKELLDLQSNVLDLRANVQGQLSSTVGLVKGYGDMAAGVATSAIKTIAGFQSMIGTIASKAGPYGMAIVAAAKLGSLFASLFRSGPPERPNIAGVNTESLTTNPLAGSEIAMFAGKIVSGREAGATTAQKSAILDAATDNLQLYLRAVEARTDRAWLSSNRISFRSMAYFISQLPSDKLFSHDYLAISPDSRIKLEQVGKMLAWAAPRIQLRELFIYWCVVREAWGYYVLSGGNANKDMPYVALAKYKILPGVNIDTDAQGDAPSAQAFAKQGVGTWLSALATRVLPEPDNASVPGQVLFHPIPLSVVNDELQNFYTSKRELKEHLVQSKQQHWALPGHKGSSVAFNETWSEAYALSQHLAISAWQNGGWPSDEWKQRMASNYNGYMGLLADAAKGLAKAKRVSVLGTVKAGLKKVAAAQKAAAAAPYAGVDCKKYPKLCATLKKSKLSEAELIAGAKKIKKELAQKAAQKEAAAAPAAAPAAAGPLIAIAAVAALFLK